jgi:flagellar hook-basal body complex protein FliE
MRQLVTVTIVSLWALAVVLPLRADDPAAQKKEGDQKGVAAGKEKAAAENPAREARVKALTEQMEKIQKELAKEAGGFPGPGTGDFKEMQLKMTAEMQKMQAAAREQTEQMRKLPEEMIRQMTPRAGAFAPGAIPGAPGFPGGPMPDASQQMLQQMKMMLQNLDNAALAGSGAGTGEHDPVEIGQKMVIAGLDVQLRGLAARINATDDKKAKETLTGEFRELIEKVVEGRKKLRDRAIVQLEKRLAELKKHGEKEESAEQMAKRLLEAAKTDATAAAVDSPTKETRKP